MDMIASDDYHAMASQSECVASAIGIQISEVVFATFWVVFARRTTVLVSAGSSGSFRMGFAGDPNFSGQPVIAFHLTGIFVLVRNDLFSPGDHILGYAFGNSKLVPVAGAEGDGGARGGPRR
jgi:hypothetical protein